jgi:lipopolysaccharide/colanic/teichoic acid biosynthesis glycosyltransferase
MANGVSAVTASAIARRLMDMTGAVFGLVLTSPLLALACLAVRLDSPGPVVFTQLRAGRGGIPFRIHKFRTMRSTPSTAPSVTAGNDVRITRVGHLLRRSKIDELPQLWDVLIGRMSLVGPRPEVPRYVAYYSAADAEIVLSVRPGITDPVSLVLRNEQALLADESDPEQYYLHVLMPIKVAVAREYVLHRTVWSDVTIIGLTILAIVGIRTSPLRWSGAHKLPVHH